MCTAKCWSLSRGMFPSLASLFSSAPPPPPRKILCFLVCYVYLIAMVCCKLIRCQWLCRTIVKDEVGCWCSSLSLERWLQGSHSCRNGHAQCMFSLILYLPLSIILTIFTPWYLFIVVNSWFLFSLFVGISMKLYHRS